MTDKLLFIDQGQLEEKEDPLSHPIILESESSVVPREGEEVSIKNWQTDYLEKSTNFVVEKVWYSPADDGCDVEIYLSRKSRDTEMKSDD